LSNELEQILGKKVDILTRDGLETFCVDDVARKIKKVFAYG